MFTSLLLGMFAASADIDMIPEDGSCMPGETILVFAPEPDTGEAWTCQWGADEALGGLDGIFLELTCPACGRHVEDQVYSLYAVCTDADGNAQWAFDDIVVRCSEVEDEWQDPTVGGCSCGAGGVMSLAWLLVVPVVWRRRAGPSR
ncbi:MAG: hypothetical protein ABIO70_24675 [Pseudomonadota bacterium]